MDTCIVIRALRWSAEGTYTARAGAGVVFDSTPSREWHETELKMRCTLGAVRAVDGDSR
jgi:anthranilate/para-aminobenzoate synthase component I